MIGAIDVISLVDNLTVTLAAGLPFVSMTTPVKSVAIAGRAEITSHVMDNGR